MWATRRQTLPSVRRSSKYKLAKAKKPAPPPEWARFSLRNTSHFGDDTLASGLGLHPDFMIPTKSRPDGMRLDGLRQLNMGHINVRYHQDYFSPKSSQASMHEYNNFDGMSADQGGAAGAVAAGGAESPKFSVPQGWKRSSSLTPVKVRCEPKMSVIKAAPPSGGGVADFNPRGSRVNKDGFFTVEQGIGTARGASPAYKASACLDLQDHELPFHLGYTFILLSIYLYTYIRDCYIDHTFAKFYVDSNERGSKVEL